MLQHASCQPVQTHCLQIKHDLKFDLPPPG